MRFDVAAPACGCCGLRSLLLAPRPLCPPSALLPAPLLAEGEIVLRGSRHPCLEAQEGVDFIPNDCLLTRGEVSLPSGRFNHSFVVWSVGLFSKTAR